MEDENRLLPNDDVAGPIRDRLCKDMGEPACERSMMKNAKSNRAKLLTNTALSRLVMLKTDIPVVRVSSV